MLRGFARTDTNVCTTTVRRVSNIVKSTHPQRTSRQERITENIARKAARIGKAAKKPGNKVAVQPKHQNSEGVTQPKCTPAKHNM